MKIFFDYRIFYHQSNGGITRYIINLSKEFQRLNNENHIIAPVHINEMLSNYSKKFKNIHGVFIKKKPLFTSKILNYLNYNLTKYYYNKIKPQIYHQTYYGNFPKLKNVIKVVTVHDLIHEKFYNLYGMSIKDRPKKTSIEEADKIICVSENTKIDLQNFYNINDKKIFVINHGHEHILNLLDDKKKIERKNEILYVGGRGKYKNFKNFIKAFVISERIKKNFNIICFGGGDFTENEVNFLKNEKIYDKITYREGDDVNLARFYKSASCLILPSLYEGFGLPIIEAFSLGCPVVASNSNSIIQTAGDAAAYFDPENIEDIADKLEITLNLNDNNENVKKGYDQVKKYKWKDCAKKTLEAYVE